MQENTRGCTILVKTVPGEVWDGRETWGRTERANDDGNCFWVGPGQAAADRVNFLAHSQNGADDDRTYQYTQP